MIAHGLFHSLPRLNTHEDQILPGKQLFIDTESPPRGLLKNSKENRNGEWIVCRRKEAVIALFLQVTINKNKKESETKQTELVATNLETQNKQNRSKSDPPKRSAKMIDGTEKPQNCKAHSAIQQISL